ncbi:UDP-N-acetylmuramoyl-L-alanyl-D-glutamate--2,6-diaminopimelate ligase [Catenovulum sp. SM1970]|uniref:UDP-N-acetylmuramoyl-L-alanyl-D-glutamate--2, 6-diaminopimelate ligase n=1 Tax=Marinifaba aquimaris TaxID=2741323 RepID=UPI001573C156|nr:UDP-N-acetylmuramoyl-L-alanyl-D-glutamate--2,6-diaminopimelate ligase [Marinifaba aquimaris]
MSNLLHLESVLNCSLPEISVNDLQLDSRSIKQGDVFVAIIGQHNDGRDYIEQAVAQGAGLILRETEHIAKHGQSYQQYNAWVVNVYQLADKQNQLAKAYYQGDIADLKLIGITGTNGKTTTADLIYQCLEQNEPGKNAYIGTLGMYSSELDIANPNTTPVAINLYRHLARFAKSGVSNVVIEVSSHALAEQRILGLTFLITAFTNLSHDHLDFHRDMDDYFQAKAKLFSDYSAQHAIVNTDNKWGEMLALQITTEHKQKPTLTRVSRSAASDLYCQHFSPNSLGFDLTVSAAAQQQNLSLPLLADFNVDNALLALGCLLKLPNWDLNQACKALAGVKGANGRMELFHSKSHCNVIVDFAHTPDGLEKALKGCRSHLTTGTKLHLVFGCGGDRDKAKRPLMAKIAAQYADHIWVTSDNPRTEQPDAIIADITNGFSDQVKYNTEVNRQIAIEQALKCAHTNDLVLVAGKGHEAYQEINGVRHPYDERHFINQLIGAAA